MTHDEQRDDDDEAHETDDDETDDVDDNGGEVTVGTCCQIRWGRSLEGAHSSGPDNPHPCP
eukprot:5959524-Pyramimonas_sp.AAC.1